MTAAYTYTAAEVEDLRQAVRKKVYDQYGGTLFAGGTTQPEFVQNQVALHTMIEDQLRTYMLAGIKAEQVT